MLFRIMSLALVSAALATTLVNGPALAQATDATENVAKKLHDDIMSRGNSVPPEQAFRAFRGRDVDTNALMRDRGFPVS